MIVTFTAIIWGCCSVAKSCMNLWDPMDCSTPGLPILHYLPEFAQTHVLWVDDAIQLSHLCCPLLHYFSFIDEETRSSLGQAASKCQRQNSNPDLSGSKTDVLSPKLQLKRIQSEMKELKWDRNIPQDSGDEALLGRGTRSWKRWHELGLLGKGCSLEQPEEQIYSVAMFC